MHCLDRSCHLLVGDYQSVCTMNELGYLLNSYLINIVLLVTNGRKSTMSSNLAASLRHNYLMRFLHIIICILRAHCPLSSLQWFSIFLFQFLMIDGDLWCQILCVAQAFWGVCNTLPENNYLTNFWPM